MQFMQIYNRTSKIIIKIGLFIVGYSFIVRRDGLFILIQTREQFNICSLITHNSLLPIT